MPRSTNINLFLVLCLTLHASLSHSRGIFDAPVGCTTFPNIRLGLCSGRGQCVVGIGENVTVVTEGNLPGSQCLCDPGWTGFNDFVNMDTHDCGTSLIALRIIWSIIFIASSFEIYYVFAKKIYPCYVVWQEHIHQMGKKDLTVTETHPIESIESEDHLQHQIHPATTTSPKTETTAENWTAVLRWPVVFTSLATLFSGTGVWILALVRIIEPRHAMGVAIGSSVLYCVWNFFFVIAERTVSFSWLAIRSKLVRFSAKDEHAATEAIVSLKRFLVFALLIDFTRVLGTLLLHAFPQYANPITCYIMTTVSVTIFFSNVGFARGGRALEQLLMSGMESLPTVARQEREHALKTIRGVVVDYRKAAFMPIFISTLSGWWPFLRAHLSYAQVQLLTTTIIKITHLNGVNPPTLHRNRQQPSTTDASRDRAQSAMKGGRGGGGGGAGALNSKVVLAPVVMSSTPEGKEGERVVVDEQDKRTKLSTSDGGQGGGRGGGREEEEERGRRETGGVGEIGIEMVGYTSTGHLSTSQHGDSTLDASTAPLVHTTHDSNPNSPESSTRNISPSSASNDPIIFNPFR